MAMTYKYASAAGSGAHDGSSEANAWSITEMANNAAAGDYVYYKGDITLGSTLSFTNSGTVAKPIVWEGYKTTPGDGYQGRSNQTGDLVTTNMPNINTGAVYVLVNATVYWVLKNLYIHSSSHPAYVVQSSSNHTFVNCAIHSEKAGIGIYAGRLINCDIKSQGGYAAYSISTALFCTFTSTGSYGCFTYASGRFLNCIFYNCAYGWKNGNHSSMADFINCTFYNCTTAAIAVGNFAIAYNMCIVNCSITDCTRAIDSDYYTTANNPVLWINNRTRDNTSPPRGFDDWITGVNIADIITDTGGPETDYVNAGAGDFRLIKNSPAIGSGLFGMDIGAVPRKVDYPAASDVWHTASAYNAAGGGTGISGTMVASDIANCSAENVKLDVVIDDVTGTYEGEGGGPVPMIGSPLIRRA